MNADDLQAARELLAEIYAVNGMPLSDMPSDESVRAALAVEAERPVQMSANADFYESLQAELKERLKNKAGG